MALRVTSNMEVTDALKAHAEAKLSVPLDKFASVINDAQDVELHMKVEKRSVHDEAHAGKVAHIGEAIVKLKGPHKTVTVTSETEDMYATIDSLEALLARKLRKAKERQEDRKIGRGQKGKSEMEGAIDDDDDDDN